MSDMQIAKQDLAEIESVLIQGDLSKLTPGQRVSYYQSVCKSMNLNPLTRPFDYILLNGKLTLYAKKDAADQLRKNNSISIGKPDIQYVDDLIIVTVTGKDKEGREDSEIGVVKKSDMQGNIANALMKAVTKAKRRLTLSICGLGWLDETEVESIPGARPVPIEGQIVDAPPPQNGNGNGNGHKPAEMTLEAAAAVTTKNGTPLGELTPDQLQIVLEQSTDETRRRAAAVLLDALMKKPVAA